MSSTALRAVRELRGDGDGRPFTPRGERPGTASGRVGTPEDAGAIETLKKELEDTKLALEKEKRNTRSLEQYVSELQTSKDNEIRDAVTEAKQHLAALQKAEQHVASVEDLYKGQVAKLTSTVERLQSRAPGAGPVDPSDSFAAVLREEMRVMQAAFTLKLARAAEDAATRVADAQRTTRSLQDALQEEKRNSASLIDKLNRVTAAAATSPTNAGTAGSTGSSHFPSAPSASRTGSAGASGSSSSRATPATSAAAGTKPVVKSSALKAK